ncbi:MAG: transcription antitermination factor NusB [Alphaproteobacteria bacterium]|jgi:N utilization substance protein B|nr:transcription antitermination factor NusB [Alphaproteobacteria bacterium]PHX98261.1 MAG: transcription antitermination factor NusB [Rhodospirillaceae bacterium]
MAAARSSSTPTVSPAAMARSAGRLAAVQALYQIEVSDLTSDSVLKDFISGRQGGMAIVEDPETAQEQFIELCEADSGLLVDIVRVVDVRGEEVDAMMTNSLSLDWPAARLEHTLKAILRAAIAELLVRTDIPPRVTISEFVDVAHAFYPGPEPRLVNAVLDRVARVLGRIEGSA